MKKNPFFKSMIVSIAFLVASLYASAQVLLTEDFDYSVGQVITATATADPMTTWVSHSGNGTSNIAISTGLIYAGYAGSGVGGSAVMVATGQDINKSFTSQNTGSVYVAFLVNVTSATTTGDYFAHFAQTSGASASTFGTRLWAKKDGSNNLSFGISKSSTASNVNYTPFSYVIGTTYLIVIKYNFVAASTNDTEDLFINPSIGVSEPTPTISTSPADNATADLTALQSFCLRQGSTSGSIQKIDGIRVATTWAEAVAPSYTLPVATPTFSVCPGFYLTAPQTVAMSSTTVGASIYYTTDKTTPVYPASGSTILYDGTPLSVSATTTIKAIAYLDGSTLSNVSTGIFTFPELIPSISTLRTADPAGFYKLTSTAVITYQAVNATGKPRFIQDETAGIMLYDGNAKTITNQYSLYDGLTNIVGTLTTNQGMLEFVPYVDPGAATSTSNTITAKEVAPDKLGENIGQLVKVKNVTITGTGNFVGSTSYVITDGTLNAKIRTQYAVADLPYIGTAIPTTTQDITGVVNIYNTTETDLVPRTAVDMSTVTAISQPSTAMKIGVNNGQLMFVAQAGESVVVYNVTGQKIISQVTVTGRNAVTVSARGVVFIKIGYQTTKVLL